MTCQRLAFSYGVHPVDLAEDSGDWRGFIREWLAARGLSAERVLLVAGPSPVHPDASHRLELIELSSP
jgi:pyruvate kinase